MHHIHIQIEFESGVCLEKLTFHSYQMGKIINNTVTRISLFTLVFAKVTNSVED